VAIRGRVSERAGPLGGPGRGCRAVGVGQRQQLGVGRGGFGRFGGVVDLQGGVRDGVVGGEQSFEVAAQAVAVGTGLDEHVRGQCGLAGGDLPDVQVGAPR